MKSIRSRLLFWLLLPLTLVAAIVSFETFYSAKRISGDLYDQTLLAAMLTISENVVSSNGTILAENTLEMLTENLGDQFYYHVRGPGGAFVTGYSGYPRRSQATRLEDGVPIFYDGIYQDVPVRIVTVRQLLTGRQLNGWTTITTWQNTTRRSELTLSLFGRSLIRMALVVLAAGAIVWIAVSFGLRPLNQLQESIERRTPYDLTPIKRSMPVELTGIVKSMNELFARVARSKKNRERFIGDAAHQLRNPIAAVKIQGEISLASKDKAAMQSGLKQIVDTANHTGKMINQMLSSATAHALDPQSGKVFDLAETVREATRLAASSAFDKNQEISLSLSHDTLNYKGHQLLLQEAIMNLIDNAIKHTGEKSVIEVGLCIRQADGLIEINVSDTGEEFGEEDLLKHSQPFATGSDSSSGSGLGLSIAKDVAKSHGGYLAVAPGKNGKGKIISIVLPGRVSD